VRKLLSDAFAAPVAEGYGNWEYVVFAGECVEAESCPCGRGLPTWRILGGRQKDILVTPTGRLYLPSSFVATPKWRGKIAGIRFYQERRDAVVVQVVRGTDYTEDDEGVLRAELGQVFNGRLVFSIAYYDSLEQTPGGKFRYVVSNVPAEP
jgi:phenylacetate-CoA ligase